MALLLPLASAVELAAKTGRTVGDARLVSALREASRRFRSQVHHSLQASEPEVIELSGEGRRSILLPALPILTISVKVDGVALVRGTDFGTKKRQGIITKLGGVWPRGYDNIEVTFTHGYVLTPDADGLLQNCPEDIQGAVLGLAEILLNVDAGVQSRTVLGDTIAFGGVATTGSTQEWSDAVANYKIHLSS